MLSLYISCLAIPIKSTLVFRYKAGTTNYLRGVSLMVNDHVADHVFIPAILTGDTLVRVELFENLFHVILLLHFRHLPEEGGKHLSYIYIATLPLSKFLMISDT